MVPNFSPFESKYSTSSFEILIIVAHFFRIIFLIEKYDLFVKSIHLSESDEDSIVEKIIEESNALLGELNKIKIGNIVTINRLVETSLGLETGVGASKKLIGTNTRYMRKMLNCLYKMNKEKFLINFKSV